MIYIDSYHHINTITPTHTHTHTHTHTPAYKSHPANMRYYARH